MTSGINGVTTPKGSHGKHVVCFDREDGGPARWDRGQELLPKRFELR
jgi:hypothetical protein